MRRAAAFAISFAAVFALANATLGTFAVGWRQSLAALAIAACGSALAIAASLRFRRTGAATGGPASTSATPLLAAFGAALALATLTGYVQHGEFFFFRWAARSGASSFARSHLLLFALLIPFAAIPFALPRTARRGRLAAPLLALLFIAAEVVAARSLFRFSHLAPIYSDDNPSFLFRIVEFWDSFPWRENYVTQWNAGVVNSVITSSGIPGYALLTAPFRLFFREPHVYHTAAMGLIHIFGAPWLAVWGFRSCRHDWPTSLVGGFLALCANRLFFVWTLHFGTVGAAVSWAAVPAAILFAYAVAEVGNTGWRAFAGLALSLSLACAWPQMWVFAAFIALAAATSCRRLLRRGGLPRLAAMSLAAAVVLAFCAHSILAVARAKELVSYTMERPEPLTWAALAKATWNMFSMVLSKSVVMQGNPLVVVFGLCGLAVMRPAPLRRWLLVILAASAIVFSFGAVRYPNLQFSRMAVPFSMALAIPAAVNIGEVLRSDSPLAAPLKGAIVLLLLFGGATVSLIWRGKGFAPFETIDPAIVELVDWIRENVPEQARVAFAGQTVHSYGHGHVAYLPVMTGREMMSCDYYGFPRGTYEPEFPPRAARKQKGGITGYFREHGVGYVVTCRQNYIDLFDAHPGKYTPAAQFIYRHVTGVSDIRVYKVAAKEASRLHGARGRVSATFNRIDVEFDGRPPESAVLAYHWNGRLSVDPPAEIAPVPTSTAGEEPFIEIRPHGATRVRIKYRPRL